MGIKDAYSHVQFPRGLDTNVSWWDALEKWFKGGILAMD